MPFGFGEASIGDFEKIGALVSLFGINLLNFFAAYVFARTAASSVVFNVVSGAILGLSCQIHCVLIEKIATISKFLFLMQMPRRLCHTRVDSSVGISNRVL